MDRNWLVSIIMPSFNSDRFIAMAIESVLNQSYKNWELFIIDGISIDKTRKIIKKYCAEDPRIKLIDNEHDQGPSHARSLGVLASRGEYIAFLDSDDIWLPHKLETQINFLVSNDYKFCFAQYKKITEEGEVSKIPMGIHVKNTYHTYLRRRGISNSSVVIQRQCLTDEIVGTFGKYHGEDTLWWLLIMKNGITAYGIEMPLIYYRTVNNSLSSKITKNQLTVWHSYRNELALGRFEAAYYYCLYVFDVLCRKLLYKLKIMALS